MRKQNKNIGISKANGLVTTELVKPEKLNPKPTVEKKQVNYIIELSSNLGNTEPEVPLKT